MPIKRGLIYEQIKNPDNPPIQMMATHKLSDYDRWFKVCRNCGYDTAKTSEKSKHYCWKCGRIIQRDYSDRALKKVTN